MMEKSETNGKTKTCPECRANFSCHPIDCWCGKLPAVRVLKEDIDCYCPACLEKMTGPEIEKTKADAPIEQKDYYYNEIGYIVFTAAYHLKRSHCCGNGCRHCPYDYKK
jgi:hypothetical protein